MESWPGVEGVLVGLDDGVVAIGGANTVTVKLFGEQTGGVMSIIEELLDPRILIPGHTHKNDVWLYAISGETGVRVGDETVMAGPGTYVMKPRNVPHTIFNPTDEQSHILQVLTPAGTEYFFMEVGEAIRAGELTDETIVEIAGRHGIVYFDDWNEELADTYNLTLL